MPSVSHKFGLMNIQPLKKLLLPFRQTSPSPPPLYENIEPSLSVKNKLSFNDQLKTDELFARRCLETSLEELNSLGPTSQPQWAQNNPGRLINRFRYFIFCYLATEYGFSHLASLSATDRVHFAHLAEMDYLLRMYTENHGTIGPGLGTEVESVIISHIKMPSDSLHVIDDRTIFRILFAHLCRYRKEEKLSQSTSVYYSKEELEKEGKYEAYARKLCEDIELTQVAVPYENKEARSLLESKIRAELDSNFSIKLIDSCGAFAFAQ
jgi:hypothetical protein